MKDFKDIQKKYTDQLIRVKVTIHTACSEHLLTQSAQMSDMANSDLEKYAKALDKYVLNANRPFC